MTKCIIYSKPPVLFCNKRPSVLWFDWVCLWWPENLIKWQMVWGKELVFWEGCRQSLFNIFVHTFPTRICYLGCKGKIGAIRVIFFLPSIIQIGRESSEVAHPPSQADTYQKCQAYWEGKQKNTSMIVDVILLTWELRSASLPLSNKIILCILLGSHTVDANSPLSCQTLSNARLAQN